MTDFIARLLAHPAMAPQTSLQQETQVLQFLHRNAVRIAPVLAQASGVSPDGIMPLLEQALMETINRDLLRSVDAIVHGIDFGFLTELGGAAPADSARAQIGELLGRLMDRAEARRWFTGPLTALHHDLACRYLDEVWRRRNYTHFELTKVQRLKLDKEQIGHMVRATLLLRPIVALVPAGSSAPDPDRPVGGRTAEQALAGARRALPSVPEPLLKSAVYSCVSFGEDRFIDATARFAAVFSARGRTYQPGIRPDRGADSPDRSWFSAARRNRAYYGFDAKLLDELYSIASENGW